MHAPVSSIHSFTHTSWQKAKSLTYRRTVTLPISVFLLSSTFDICLFQILLIDSNRKLSDNLPLKHSLMYCKCI